MYKTNNNSLHDNMSQKSSAYLEIIVGSMFSQKTSKLVDIYKKCNFGVWSIRVGSGDVTECRRINKRSFGVKRKSG